MKSGGTRAPSDASPSPRLSAAPSTARRTTCRLLPPERRGSAAGRPGEATPASASCCSPRRPGLWARSSRFRPTSRTPWSPPKGGGLALGSRRRAAALHRAQQHARREHAAEPLKLSAVPVSKLARAVQVPQKRPLLAVTIAEVGRGAKRLCSPSYVDGEAYRRIKVFAQLDRGEACARYEIPRPSTNTISSRGFGVRFRSTATHAAMHKAARRLHTILKARSRGPTALFALHAEHEPGLPFQAPAQPGPAADDHEPGVEILRQA